MLNDQGPAPMNDYDTKYINLCQATAAYEHALQEQRRLAQLLEEAQERTAKCRLSFELSRRAFTGDLP